jgi:D-alanine transaminase
LDEVYLNGAFLRREAASLPLDDRGFLFGDGVYEVSPFYGGVPFRLNRHLDRLRRGLKALQIDFDLTGLEEIHAELLLRNGMGDAEAAMVYVQVTRGAAPRAHPFPDPPTRPTVYAYAKRIHPPSQAEWARGYSAVTVQDLRWARADLKTVQLLPNVLAQQTARAAGASDALLVRDGLALEGALTNLFVVFGERVATHPLSNQILPGITREAVVEVARSLGFGVEERPIPLEELREATELFFTGTTAEVRPVIQVDGRPIGNGRVGPISRRLHEGLLERIQKECAETRPS